MSEWLVQILVPTATAVLGFLGNEAVGRWRRRKEERSNYHNALHDLRALLDESRSLFQSQNYQARVLLKALRSRLGDNLPPGPGFDSIFRQAYEGMIDDERELHSIIRSTTMNSLKRVNGQLLEWLKKNARVKRDRKSLARQKLAQELSALDLHLSQWLDKYEATIPNDQKYALVYLDDEKKHGTAFPKGIEGILEEVIKQA